MNMPLTFKSCRTTKSKVSSFISEKYRFKVNLDDRFSSLKKLNRQGEAKPKEKGGDVGVKRVKAVVAEKL